MDAVDKLKNRVLDQFDLMEEEFSCDFDDVCEDVSDVKLKEEFLDKVSKLKELYEEGSINPYFDLNLNLDDNNDPVDDNVDIVFFAFSGNPPHWGHIMAGFDALVDYEADKVVFVSNGDDPRKDTLRPVDVRYELVKDVVDLFSPFFEFSEIAKKPYFDEDVPMIGEYTLFRFFKLNEDSNITAYYFAGSDHLNRYVEDDDGNKRLDTVGHLEKCIDDSMFGFNSDLHDVIGLFNARDKEEFEENLENIDDPEIDIERLDPTISFSSTQIRNALKGEDDEEKLIILPFINYVKIKENGWYQN